MLVTILIGARGSGKTTLARGNYPSTRRASADKYPGLYDENGDIDPKVVDNG